jgi:hypothetical protein
MLKKILISFLSCFIFISEMVSCRQPGRQFYGDKAFSILNKYSNFLQKTEGFEVFGTGGAMTTNVKSVFVSYVSNKNVGLEEARKIYISVIENLVKEYNNDKEIRPYLNDYPFTYNNIDLHISFKNKGNYIGNKKIAFILKAKGIIYYDIFDEKLDDFIDIYQEPYEEGLKIINQNKLNIDKK